MSFLLRRVASWVDRCEACDKWLAVIDKYILVVDAERRWVRLVEKVEARGHVQIGRLLAIGPIM